MEYMRFPIPVSSPFSFLVSEDGVHGISGSSGGRVSIHNGLGLVGSFHSAGYFGSALGFLLQVTMCRFSDGRASLIARYYTLCWLLKGNGGPDKNQMEFE